MKLTDIQQRKLNAAEDAYTRYKTKRATIDAEFKKLKEQELSGLLFAASVAANEAKLSNVPASQIKEAMGTKNYDTYKNFMAVAAGEVSQDSVIESNEAERKAGLPRVVFETERNDKWPQFAVSVSGVEVNGVQVDLEFSAWTDFYSWICSDRSVRVGTKPQAEEVMREGTKVHEALMEAYYEWKERKNGAGR